MSNKNYVAIVVAILIVLAGGGWFLRGRNAYNSNPSGGAVGANEIVYTDSGFSPSAVNVKVGDTVTFKNQSSGGMWVASAPHPTHTDYPEFDAKKMYNQGESYSFMFTKQGNWKFHNHLGPTKFGAVNVQ